MTNPQPGGFLPDPNGLLSPPPSSTTGSTSFAGAALPTPRSHPLKAGSPKETAFINYVDKGIQEVGRRFALKRGVEEGFEGEDGGDGYTRFGEAARDLEKLVEVVWVSGTRK